MKNEYPKVGQLYYHHDDKIGEVRVLFVAGLYGTEEEYVAYVHPFSGVHGVIPLSLWNEPIVDKKGKMYDRFY